jgi:hypothetical protein
MLELNETTEAESITFQMHTCMQLSGSSVGQRSTVLWRKPRAT